MMYGEAVLDTIIPAGHGMAFEVRKGQVFRLYLVEDRQVGDCVFYNANDYKEWFHIGQSWAINAILGTGDAHSFQHFYSKPPRENVMLTVVEDTVKNHWGNMGGRCSARLAELSGHGNPGRSCQQNLTEALAPYGLTGDDVNDVFNVFMNVEMDANGNFTFKVPETVAGDHIDMRAEMDILAGISACPNDNGPINDGRSKPLGVTIFSG